MKRILCLLLSLSIFAGTFMGMNIDAFAENAIDTETITKESVYYTDLFYAYPQYLSDSSYFKTYNADIDDAFTTVFNNYANSPDAIGTGIEEALSIFTSPTDIAIFATDYLGITNYKTNDALDSANKKIMLDLMSGTVEDDVFNEYNGIDKTVKKVQRAFKTLDEIYAYNPGDSIGDPQEDKFEYNVKYYLRESYMKLYDEGIIKKFDDLFISRLYNEISSADIKLSEYFTPSVKAIDATKSLLQAVMIEDTKLELIDELLATQKEGTLLKTGMLRLKSQLQGGSAVYFLNTYIKSKVADKICGIIDGVVTEMIEYKTIANTVSVIKNVVFSIWDVPNYDDVMTFKVLAAYSYNLLDSINAQHEVFKSGPFASDVCKCIDEYNSTFSIIIQIEGFFKWFRMI